MKIGIREYKYFDSPYQNTAIVFYCLVCRNFVTRLSFVASMEIGGWACYSHTPEELAAAKDNVVIRDRMGIAYNKITKEKAQP